MTLQVEVSIEAPGWASLPDVEPLVQRAVEQAAASVEIPLTKGAEVSVMLGDDATIRALNRQWRGLDHATNVLSFPAGGPGPLAERHFLGDIAIAYDTVVRESADAKVSPSDHLSHLVVHGFLHLVGHDHETEIEAEAMEALEVKVLAELGIADPYADSDPVEADHA